MEERIIKDINNLLTQLFQKMHDAGYTFDFEKKELKKIVVPIFNISDTIAKKHNSYIHDFGSFTITDITGGKYWYNDRIICDIAEQDEWELVEQKPTFEMKTPEESLGIDSDTYSKIVDECVYGEQKSAWSEEDEKTLNSILNDLRQNVMPDREDIDWLKSLKERVQPQPKQEWSEKDENIISDAEVWLDTLCDYLKDSSSEDIPNVRVIISKLKSIKGRHTWKPSEEQMGVIEAVINNRSFQRRHLDSLYEQLKKLREE